MGKVNTMQKTRMLTTKFYRNLKTRQIDGKELKCPKCGYKHLFSEKIVLSKSVMYKFSCKRCRLIDEIEITGNCRTVIDAYCKLFDRFASALKNMRPPTEVTIIEEKELINS